MNMPTPEEIEDLKKRYEEVGKFLEEVEETIKKCKEMRNERN